MPLTQPAEQTKQKDEEERRSMAVEPYIVFPLNLSTLSFT